MSKAHDTTTKVYRDLDLAIEPLKSIGYALAMGPTQFDVDKARDIATSALAKLRQT